MGYSRDLARGDGWFMCCLCFKIHKYPYPDAHVDEEGKMWDYCKNEECPNDF